MLPNGWKNGKLGDLCTFKGGFGFKEIHQGHEKGDLPFIKVSDMNRAGNEVHINSSNNWISHDQTREMRVKTFPPHSIVFAKVGAALLLNRRRILSRDTIIDNNMMAAVSKTTCYYNYLFYILSAIDFGKFVQEGAVPSINQGDLSSFKISYPPLHEQKKIAAILSTWDRAIEGTEKLLANSQQQKKALMQQLLTGKKRLPGFTGEWLRYKLGEIADFLKGKGLSKADINPKGKTPCIHYGSLFTEQPSTITETKTLTNTFKGAVFSKKNDVLMPTSDVTPAGLAVASAIQKNNVLLGNDILIIRPNSERLYGPFLSRVIRNSKKNILSFATGTTVFHLYASDMKGFLLLVPPLPEQRAIAAVLTTADEEITALKSDLSRLRQEKKALMQQLLTGKRRVTVD